MNEQSDQTSQLGVLPPWLLHDFDQ